MCSINRARARLSPSWKCERMEVEYCVAEEDLHRFAGLSGDWNLVHFEDKCDARWVYGERIAHGMISLANFRHLRDAHAGPWHSVGDPARSLPRPVPSWKALSCRCRRNWKGSAPGDHRYVDWTAKESRSLLSGGSGKSEDWLSQRSAFLSRLVG
jgi:hypothetical protein